MLPGSESPQYLLQKEAPGTITDNHRPTILVGRFVF